MVQRPVNELAGATAILQRIIIEHCSVGCSDQPHAYPDEKRIRSITGTGAIQADAGAVKIGASVKLAYFTSRIYAGYAKTPLSPEPYVYEEAFAMRWLIQDQIAGKPALNYDAAKGEVKSPLLLWGPYLWADGETPRKADGLIYKREDLRDDDGTHPSDTGRQKVAEQLLMFLKTDATAKSWFTGKSSKAGAR
jgi:hypothetical protein